MACERIKAMKFFAPGFRFLLLFLVSAFFLTGEYSFAQTAKPVKIPTAVICGQSTGNPPAPAIADKFTLDFSDGVLSGVRPALRLKGRETYKGSVDPSGKIQLSGIGRFDDHSSEWASAYAGQLQEKKPTILQGSVRVKGAVTGVRKCTIQFLMPPADLMKVLAPKEAAAQPRPQ